MNNSIFKKVDFKNEPILKYLPGSPERKELESVLEELSNDFIEIPIVINGKEIKTGDKKKCRVPHDHETILGEYHLAGKEEAQMAIDAALKAKLHWENLPWDQRVSIFLRAAELAAGPWRSKLNAATMLSQSKTYKQAEIDSACELVDFLRYNAAAIYDIYEEQPFSTNVATNKMDYRPLEGFIFAVSPFNFTAIGSNLVGAPAIAGNTLLWKPASTAVYSAYVVFQIFKEAGLPDGIINFIPSNSAEISEAILGNKNLSGIHFTGSTKVFQEMWQTVGQNIHNYKSFPRLVGETGGKNYVIAHSSANLQSLGKLLTEGAFEYQGQKCSAASRAYIPSSIWPEFKEILLKETQKIKVGDIKDFDTYMGAVIDSNSFNKIKSYIDYAKLSEEAEILEGGDCDDSKGYFVEPTIILTTNPKFKTMEEEIFGPVLTVYLYDEKDFSEVLRLVNDTSQYGLTGSVFAQDRYILSEAEKILRHASGNFYINDRPTGAVVGQQPFGGSRLSGTNDKAGSKLNLIRWMSPRVIKEKVL